MGREGRGTRSGPDAHAAVGPDVEEGGGIGKEGRHLARFLHQAQLLGERHGRYASMAWPVYLHLPPHHALPMHTGMVAPSLPQTYSIASSLPH